MEALDGFWEDTENASKLQKEKSVLEEIANTYKTIKDLSDEFDILCDYAADGDEDSAKEALSVYERFLASFLEAERKVLLSDEFDPNNAIVTFNAGAGGTESCDWCYMLFRMINKWAEKKGFKVAVMDHQPGDTAGLKSATLMINGNYAYGLLKSESGVHRLVRISPFDSNARRHTSFASIYVGPEIDDNVVIEIQDKDIRVDVFRAGGAGGQGVNTTDSAVRITHHPSGIVVVCQNERSQIQNRAQAMKILRARLYEKVMEERRAKEAAIEASKMEIGWGSQIRSYVLHPYKMVKDHRTDCETAMPDRVLDGDLDDFMDSFLRWNVEKKQVSSGDQGV